MIDWLAAGCTLMGSLNASMLRVQSAMLCYALGSISWLVFGLHEGYASIVILNSILFFLEFRAYYRIRIASVTEVEEEEE